MKQFIKPFTLIFTFFLFSQAFAQNAKIYPAFETFYYESYNNSTKTERDYEPLFNNALTEAQALSDEYEKNLRMAWCYYILSNTWYNLENPTKTEEACDLAVQYAKQARNLKENEDSLLIYINAIGQNCQVKPFTYLTAHGVEVGPTAKKIIKLNPKNGRAVFLRDSQDVYAPAPFNNYKRGADNMKKILADNTLNMPPQVLFDVLCAETFALIKLDKKNEARSYLEQARLLFPNNKSLKKLEEQL